MTIQLRGRQTQFYIDVMYGIAFAVGFAYLLFVDMDPRVAAFQGGLVFGYFLRVWENMSVYERILAEEVAGEAEEAVAAEIDERMPEEAEEAVAAEIDERVPEEVTAEVEQQVSEEVTAEVEDRIGDVDERIDREVGDRLADEELDERIEERVDERIESVEETDAS